MPAQTLQGGGGASHPGKGNLQLSVLIPVYNWDVSALLRRVIGEADAFDLWGRVEVIVLDDGSSEQAPLDANAAFLSRHVRPFLEFSSLEGNVGRSAVRNLLAAKAKGEFILFLDCDVLPDDERFLRNYLERAHEGEFDVVCGGVSYRTRTLNHSSYDYHAYLGERKEVKPASDRNREPWRHILTSNIMVRKSVFVGIPFDERFTGYGYEDIEWGVRLAAKFRILHIDNTASHLGLVTKAVTYEKMRSSVPNYLLLREICPQAFTASTLSRLVTPLTGCSDRVLYVMDRILKRFFLNCRNNPLSFLLFQLNFAVLLAGSLKERSRAGRAHPDL